MAGNCGPPITITGWMVFPLPVTPSTSSVGRPVSLRWLDPSHRPVLRRAVPFLVFLAVIQLLAWLLHTDPNKSSTPGASVIPYYLALHTLMETVSIVIAMMVFAVGWNNYEKRSSGNLVLLASVFFAVGLLDFSHLAAYAGMPDFLGPNDANKHLHFWMGARFLAAFVLLVVCIRPWEAQISRSLKHGVFAGVVILVVVLNWAAVAQHETLPMWFVLGEGLTWPKKALEYLYILMNLVTAGLLLRHMRVPQPFNAALLFAAVTTLAMSELYFTLYTTMTGAYNVLGHVYKVIAYLFIYRAVVVENVERPYRELAKSRQNLELAVRASGTGLWSWDVGTGLTYFSPVWKSQLGYKDHELSNQASTWESLLHPEDRVAVLSQVRAFMQAPGGSVYENEYRMRHKDGSYRWIMARGEKHCDQSGKAVRLMGSHTDITERKRAERRFRSAVKASPNAMVMVNAEGTVVLTNTHADTLFGYATGTLTGQPLSLLLPPALRQDHEANRKAFMENPSDRPMGADRHLTARHRDGHEIRVEVGLTPIEEEDGQYVLASVVDITQRLEDEARINKLIYYDVLTGLPNRLLLQDRVIHALAMAQRTGQRVALLLMDLDHFKNVNDRLGHAAGDRLLQEIAQRIVPSLRDSDTVARVGGDEFVMVLPQVQEDDAARVAQKLLTALARPYQLAGQELVVTSSIGIALYPNDGRDFETLYRHADTAMYRAKQDGRNDLCFFAAEMQQRTERVMQLESAMHLALERQQFHLLYQPQLTVDGLHVVGVEALLRWHHPEMGPISPAEFIPIAESNGQIIPIGAWVLQTAVRQLRAWMDVGLPPMVMAVNLSAVQFRHSNLPALVTQTLETAKLPPEYLELELTESVAMDKPQNAMAVMDDLHARGVRLSIDDFGTGYSSLSYLKRFSVYKLKIDQSFVRDIATDADDRGIVAAIVQLARSLGFKTIAEGVETQAQHEFLSAQGCDEVQGYLFSRPLAADQMETFLQKITARAAAVADPA